MRAEPGSFQRPEAAAESELLCVVDWLAAQDHQRMPLEGVVNMRKDGVRQGLAQINAGNLDAKQGMQGCEREHGHGRIEALRHASIYGVQGCRHLVCFTLFSALTARLFRDKLVRRYSRRIDIRIAILQ
jgi:hypothetical protein